MEPYCTEETPSQSQLQSSSQPQSQPPSQLQPLSQSSTLVELVVCRRNNQLYRKGEESKDGTITGRELQPQGYYPPRLFPICESRTRTGETYYQYLKRAIGEANPRKDVFNAYVVGDEEGVRNSRISVSYYKI